jgi:hypothetical protein
MQRSAEVWWKLQDQKAHSKKAATLLSDRSAVAWWSGRTMEIDIKVRNGTQ